MVEGAGLENRYRGNSFVGSNPTPSAKFRYTKFGEISPFCFTKWRIRNKVIVVFRFGYTILKEEFSNI